VRRSGCLWLRLPRPARRRMPGSWVRHELPAGRRGTGDSQPLIAVAEMEMQPVRLGPPPWRKRPPAFRWMFCLKVYRRRALLSFRCGRADRRDAIGYGPMRLLARSAGEPR
jgi:hypothetical protein